MSRASDTTGEPSGDPWAAFGYLVSGVVVYGAAGFGLSVWLHASYWIPIGIVVGAGFGIYMVFARYRYRGEADQAPTPPTPIEPEMRSALRTERDDRGDDE